MSRTAVPAPQSTGAPHVIVFHDVSHVGFVRAADSVKKACKVLRLERTSRYRAFGVGTVKNPKHNKQLEAHLAALARTFACSAKSMSTCARQSNAGRKQPGIVANGGRGKELRVPAGILGKYFKGRPQPIFYRRGA
jgi:hypothetical protein